MSPYPLSVIIPAYNKAAVLAVTLAALAGQEFPAGSFEVIVVDDGSSDGTAELVRQGDYPFALRLLQQARQGAGAARNLGAGAASGEVLLFLDADIVASPGLLQAHWDAQRAHGRAFVVGRIRPYNATGRAAAGPGIHDVFAGSFDLGPQARALPPGFAVSGNLSARSADFALAGGFDAGLPRGQDIELARRAAARGFELIYAPEALAYHNHVLTLPEMSRKVREDHAALVILFRKHPEMLGDFAYLEDKWPVAWRRDGLRLIVRKSAYRLLAAPPLRSGLSRICQLLERKGGSPQLLRFMVWKWLGACQWLGLRDGMRRCGWRPDARQ